MQTDLLAIADVAPSLFVGEKFINNDSLQNDENSSLIALQRICSILLSGAERIDYESIAKTFGLACNCHQAGIMLIAQSNSDDFIVKPAGIWSAKSIPVPKGKNFKLDQILCQTSQGQSWIAKLAQGQLIKIHHSDMPDIKDQFQDLAFDDELIVSDLALVPCLVEDKLAACLYIVNYQNSDFSQGKQPVSTDWSQFAIELLQMCSLNLAQALLVAKHRKAKHDAENRHQRDKRLESLGILAGGIAHDYNNLLTVILGSAELIFLEVQPGSSVHQLAGEIRNASLKARDLTYKMLTYSGNCKLVFDLVEINELVLECANNFSHTLPDNLDLNLSLANENIIITADRGQILQAIENLIVNAQEAIAGQAGSIEISTEILDMTHQNQIENLRVGNLSPGKYAAITIEDSGCGINEITCEKLFDPFFSTKYLGRGLGLPAVYGIVKSHSGGISVYSEVGAGSKFQILLPVAPTKSD